MTKILIVGPSWVGDMVMAQSLFRMLKLLHPNSVIDVLAPEWSLPILERMPEVRNAITLAVVHGKLNLKLRYQLAASLKSVGYDQAIVLPNSWKSALIPWFAKIPKRTGWHREMRWMLLNDARQLNKKALPRMVERYVALAFEKNDPLHSLSNKQLFPPKLEVRADSVEIILNRFSMQKPSRPLLILCPGAEFGPSKRWPLAYYATVANQKIKEGFEVWMLGSKKDQIVAAQILKHCDSSSCVDFTGVTSLAENIDLLSLADVVISNDSGLMHIAAALNKPLIALYGSTDPSFTPPLNPEAQIMRLGINCSPCFKRECPLEHHRCMRELTPEKVLQAMNSGNSVNKAERNVKQCVEVNY